MTTRDAYVALLEKRATSGDADVLHESIPDNDSVQAATEEHNQNREDVRQYLHTTFSNAEAVQSNQSAELKKLFSSIPSGADSSNPLIKLGRAVFFRTLDHGNFLKTASPVHIEVAYNAFVDELEKIAGPRVFGGSTMGAGRQALRGGMTSPASIGGAATAAAPKTLPQGSGTSVHTGGGGILARMLGR